MSKAGESAFSARRERARLLPFRRGLPHSAGLYPQRAQIRFVLGRDAVAFDRFLNRFIVYPRGEAAFFDEWDRAFALLCDTAVCYVADVLQIGHGASAKFHYCQHIFISLIFSDESVLLVIYSVSSNSKRVREFLVTVHSGCEQQLYT